MSNADRAKRIAEKWIVKLPVHSLETWQEAVDKLAALILSELPPESAQGPRCPKCGSGDLYLGNSANGVWITCRHCGQIEPLNKPADFAQFFGPASQEVRELVEAAEDANDELFSLLNLLSEHDCNSVTVVRDRLRSALAALKEKT